jgi:glycerophosphoryl diester phosphodiesterase
VTRPLVIAHRGAPRDGAAENTVAAFERAALDGWDGVELDVRGTRDLRAAVFHDRTLRDEDGRKARLDTLDFAAARRRAAGWGLGLPSLEEALEVLSGRTGLVLEVKEARIAREVARVLREQRALQRLPWLLVVSFDPEVVIRFQGLLPGVQTGLVVATRLTPLRVLHASLAPLDVARECDADALLLRHDLLSSSRVRNWWERDQGRTYAWTVNDRESARRAARLGVDGIITDDPAMVRRALENPPHPPLWRLL